MHHCINWTDIELTMVPVIIHLAIPTIFSKCKPSTFLKPLWYLEFNSWDTFGKISNTSIHTKSGFEGQLLDPKRVALLWQRTSMLWFSRLSSWLSWPCEWYVNLGDNGLSFCCHILNHLWHFANAFNTTYSPANASFICTKFDVFQS